MNCPHIIVKVTNMVFGTMVGTCQSCHEPVQRKLADVLPRWEA